MQTRRILRRKKFWTSAGRCLSAAENSSAITEKLYRSMNLVDPPTDYSPLLR
jgi:hypothetical protein